MWKNALQSKGKVHLEKLPSHISAIKYAVIQQQSTSMPEETRTGHWQSIHLQVALAFKCENMKTMQNHIVYYLRDNNNQQKQRFLCKKFKDKRDKQKERNMTLQMK